MYFYNYVSNRAVWTTNRYANNKKHATAIANLIIEEKGWKYYNVACKVTEC